MDDFYHINVNDYSLYIGDDFSHIISIIHDIDPSSVTILVDENTEKFCLPILSEKLSAIYFSTITLKSGELNKNIDSCQKIWEKLIEMKVDRKGLIINLSGGVLIDMGGFIASTYKRGILFINIPTTLLSMIDASIGGKNGFNFCEIKNSIGLFSQPSAVFIHPIFLRTLPQREMNSGIAEMIKHGLIADKNHLMDAISLLENGWRREEISKHIYSSVLIKKEIVLEDPEEQGLRKTLNFGHTAGHAFESFFLSEENSILHGEAVAHGIIISLLLSIEKLNFPTNEAEKIISSILNTFPKLIFFEKDFSKIIALMKNDKKNRDSHMLFVLLKNIGNPVIDIIISENDLITAFHSYQKL